MTHWVLLWLALLVLLFNTPGTFCSLSASASSVSSPVEVSQYEAFGHFLWDPHGEYDVKFARLIVSWQDESVRVDAIEIRYGEVKILFPSRSPGELSATIVRIDSGHEGKVILVAHTRPITSKNFQVVLERP